MQNRRSAVAIFMNEQSYGHPPPPPMQPSSRSLSSQLTFLMKFVFPAVWIGGFAIGTLVLFFSSALQGRDGEPPDPGLKWIFLGITCAGTVFLWWICMRLKCVRMDDKALYISN